MTEGGENGTCTYFSCSRVVEIQITSAAHASQNKISSNNHVSRPDFWYVCTPLMIVNPDGFPSTSGKKITTHPTSQCKHWESLFIFLFVFKQTQLLILNGGHPQSFQSGPWILQLAHSSHLFVSKHRRNGFETIWKNICLLSCSM